MSLASILGDTLQAINQIDSIDFEFIDMVTGEYIISILDSDGCLYVDTINLTQIPNPLVMQTNVSHVNCYGVLMVR